MARISCLSFLMLHGLWGFQVCLFPFCLYCIHLPLLLHPSPPSASCSPALQCWMLAILPLALLFSGEANGGTSIKGHWAPLLLALRRSLYSDWVAVEGLVAFFAVSSDLPFWPWESEQSVQLHICSRSLQMWKIWFGSNLHINCWRRFEE